MHTPPKSPENNPFAESQIGRFKIECLDHFVCVSLSQLDYIVAKWREFYLHHRPHQGKGNKPLDASFVPKAEGKVKCVSFLGGLLKSYYRDSA
jgi:putative transposase